jgi:NAD(P)-dependent dehydrogenase (short-subunit alcohol dehydrogenase family)
MGLEAFSLEGKTALITGGGTGIGLGIAQEFINANAKVILSGRREDVLKNACDTLGENAYYIVSDLSILSAIPALVTEIESKFGPIDILVNNAGIHLKKWAQETTDEEFLNIIQTNLLSVFALTREVAKGMLERKNGSIILISSMAGLFGIDRVSAYGTSKTALIGLMNNLVTEYSRDNVRINCIAPGWITSNMFLNAINQDQERKQKIVNRIALPDFGKPEDIGNAAVYLSSQAGRYVTGVVLPVDGGASVNF